MVSEQMDMLDEDDARPEQTSTVDPLTDEYRKVEVIESIAENGEAIIELRDGSTEEIHGHDSHFFPYEGVVFTEDEKDREAWLFAEEIVSVRRH